MLLTLLGMPDLFGARNKFGENSDFLHIERQVTYSGKKEARNPKTVVQYLEAGE